MESEDGIDWSHVACRVMTIGDREGQVFLFYPHSKNGFFFSLITQYLIYIGKKLEKDFQKILNTLRCGMETSFYHFNDVTDRRAAIVRLFFLSLPRAGTGM